MQGGAQDEGFHGTGLRPEWHQHYGPMAAMTNRRLLAVRQARRDDVADLVTHMAISATPVEMIDPFLVLAHHGPQTFPPNNGGLPFTAHPHRGFETVTFILDSELVHRDSDGHESAIGPGGIQWMTAGAGVVHSETSPRSFLESGGRVEILQLWLNLPRRLKMVRPSYTGLNASEVPEVRLPDGGTLSLASGSLGGTSGPITSLTDTFMSILRFDSPGEAALPAPSGRSVLFYVVHGMVEVDGQNLPDRSLGIFETTGDLIRVRVPKGALVLYGHAEPLNEPVVVRGPFVMNTAAEIDDAYKDFRAGRIGNAAADQ